MLRSVFCAPRSDRCARNENRVEQCFHNVLVLYTLFHCKWSGRVCAECLASHFIVHPIIPAQQLGSDSQFFFFFCVLWLSLQETNADDIIWVFKPHCNNNSRRLALMSLLELSSYPELCFQIGG